MQRMECPEPMDLAILRKELHESEEKNELAICEETDTDILTDDFDADRMVNYHLVQPTKEWLSSLFLCGASCKEQVEAAYKKRIIELFLAVDQNMLITLRRIIIVATAGDIEEVCKALDADEFYEWPDCIGYEEEDDTVLRDGALGCYWHMQGAIIINLASIERAAEETVAEFARDGMYESESTISAEGVYTTAAHELRHLGLANPYLSVKDYPLTEESEEAVEEWGRAAYDLCG